MKRAAAIGIAVARALPLALQSEKYFRKDLAEAVRPII